MLSPKSASRSHAINQLSDLYEPGGGSILPSVYTTPQRRLTGERKGSTENGPLDIKEGRRREDVVNFDLARERRWHKRRATQEASLSRLRKPDIRTQRCRPSKEPRNFSDSVIFQTTPQPESHVPEGPAARRGALHPVDIAPTFVAVRICGAIEIS